MTEILKTFRIGCYAFFIYKGNFIFGLKTQGPFVGIYDLIGGGMEHGESPIETLNRELYEEIGFIYRNKESNILNIYSDVVEFDKWGKHFFQHILGIVYLIRLDEYCKFSVQETEISEILEVKPDEVHKIKLTPIAKLAVDEYLQFNICK